MAISKHNLAGTDPVHSPADRLFLVWHAYDVEEGLLQDWHNSTAHDGSTNNELLDFFLDTWGKGDWTIVRRDPPPNFPDTAYFQALGVVSHQLRQEIRKNVLDEILVPEGDKFKLPPKLKDGVTREYADKRAQAEIDKILSAFRDCEIKSLRVIDREAANQADNNCEGQNIYLHALVRMMDIETHCFVIQKNFLETGRP